MIKLLKLKNTQSKLKIKLNFIIIKVFLCDNKS